MTNLEILVLADNAGLSGPLPGSYAGLRQLRYLNLTGTQLCAPTDSAFQAWLRGVETKEGVTSCAAGNTTPTPTPTPAPTGRDYDVDDDGLIEVASLEQLDAIRHDLDGDGSPANATAYGAAFPDALAGMGCPSAGCQGYELTTNLDFDPTDNDDYRSGWTPIGSSSWFNSTFEGNGHTIDDLLVKRGSNVGLFGTAGTRSDIRRVKLTDVNVNVKGQRGRFPGGSETAAQSPPSMPTAA